MKIYLAGSISGGREFEKGIKAIAKVLQDEGHEILTPFVVDSELNTRRFPNLTGKERDRAIFREDLNLLVMSDAIIAEVSKPSTGVGIELGFLLGMMVFNGVRKPTLALVDDSLREKRNSSLLGGNPYVRLLYYSPECIPDLKEKLEVFLVSFETLDQKILRERGF